MATTREHVEITYVVCDATGDYIRSGYDVAADEPAKRTPCSDQAHEFTSREEALAACERHTDTVCVLRGSDW